MSTDKILTASEQQAEFLATLQHSCHCACNFFHLTKRNYKWDFERRLRWDRGRIGTDDFVLNDVSNSVTEAPKLEHVAERRYQVMWQDQHSIVI